jgi:hypothetical protein
MRSAASGAEGSRRHGDLVEDLLVVREPAFLLLREDLLPIQHHDESAAVAFDERGLDATLLADLGRQTGGTREISSLNAVGDLDLHCVLPRVDQRPGLEGRSRQ